MSHVTMSTQSNWSAFDFEMTKIVKEIHTKPCFLFHLDFTTSVDTRITRDISDQKKFGKSYLVDRFLKKQLRRVELPFPVLLPLWLHCCPVLVDLHEKKGWIKQRYTVASNFELTRIILQLGSRVFLFRQVKVFYFIRFCRYHENFVK